MPFLIRFNACHWFFLSLLVVLRIDPAWSQDVSQLCGQTIRVGVRDDAPPFSYNPSKLLSSAEEDEAINQCGGDSELFPDHSGYTVEICARFLEGLAKACISTGLPVPTVDVVSLLAGERLATLIRQGEQSVDLLCGATTATVWLSGRLPRTLYTFVTPTSALLSDRVRNLNETQCRIGVIRGTTSSNERAEDTMLPGWSRFVRNYPLCGSRDEPPTIAARYDDYQSALEDVLLNSNDPQSDLLIGDNNILEWYQANLSKLSLTSGVEIVTPPIVLQTFTLEPYAIFGGHDDQELVASLNLYLARLQREDSFLPNLASCFGRRVDSSFQQLLEIQRLTPLGVQDPLPTVVDEQ